jgi:hypothetical protein
MKEQKDGNENYETLQHRLPRHPGRYGLGQRLEVGCRRGMAAALAMGAEGVQIGTRFAATVESSAHENFKRAMTDASPTLSLQPPRKEPIYGHIKTSA